MRIAPPAAFVAKANLTLQDYQARYDASLRDPEGFWAEQARRLDWFVPWTKVKNTRFAPDVSIRWFEGGKLNVSHNCLDRHLEKWGDKPAIVWEPDNPNESARILTFRELHAEVCKLASVLRSRGVKKGDRVTIYLPMLPEAVIAMLACTRIGAAHSVVFGGFSADSLKGRIEDCGSTFLITADESLRGGKTVPLKANADEALKGGSTVRNTLVYRRTGGNIAWQEGRDLWWHEEMAKADAGIAPVAMDAEDPLFILYTSGSTGKPKGVLHTTGGYLLYASFTHECVFDLKEDDVFWCTADVGWVTGHSYTVYGPLSNGATTVMFEGVPNYPDPSRFWQVVDKHKVTIFYTAPTAIRALEREGTEWVKKASRKSLRLLGSVGEPINPEAWMWYYENVGEKRCPVVDTWWQTETGACLMTPLPGVHDLRPGLASFPFFGVKPEIIDEKGTVLDGECEGYLVLADSWPGQARTIWGDHDRFVQTYFSQYQGKYFTGDGAKRDRDGFYRITGRVDDVLNVAGHRIGTAEVEAALNSHPLVVESAVVGMPHDIKGQGIYAYVILTPEAIITPGLEKELRDWVRKEIGPIASPEVVHIAPGLPKTRSGKIMRRILRKIAEGETGSLGDTSTLLNPEIVDLLLSNKIVKSA
ncbi:MAG: acetate--CoA ligase [Alphaproteobacteria bacterium]|nr:acetate--CoA ligase [Alphaproteobacteria bacterium]